MSSSSPPPSSSSVSSPSPSLITIDSTAIVCSDSTLDGNITIGPHSILHPKVILLSHKGKITIGSHCIVEEFVVIESKEEEGIIIGDYSHLQVGSMVYSSVGIGCIMEPRSVLLPPAKLSNGCHVKSTICVDFTPEENSILFGENVDVRIREDNGKKNCEEIKPKVDLLKDCLAKSHKLLTQQ